MMRCPACGARVSSRYRACFVCHHVLDKRQPAGRARAVPLQLARPDRSGHRAAQNLKAHSRNIQMLMLRQAKQNRTVTLHLDSVTGYTKPFDYTAVSEIEVGGR